MGECLKIAWVSTLHLSPCAHQTVWATAQHFIKAVCSNSQHDMLVVPWFFIHLCSCWTISWAQPKSPKLIKTNQRQHEVKKHRREFRYSLAFPINSSLRYFPHLLNNCFCFNCLFCFLISLLEDWRSGLLALFYPLSLLALLHPFLSVCSFHGFPLGYSCQGGRT